MIELKISFKRISFALLILLIVAAVSSPFALAEQTDTQDAISSAKKNLLACFSAVKDAEAAGGNVTSLIDSLNAASTYLSEAELAYSRNDSSLAFSLAVQSQTQLSSFLSQANTVRDAATEQKNQSFLLAIASLIVAIVILGMGIISWIYLSKKTNFQKGKFMNFAKYKMVILIFMVALALFVASPGIQHFSVIPQTDPISELSILGSQQTAANYPSNVLSGENNLVFLDIANHLGHAAYYMVQIKLFNQTQLISGAVLPSFYNMTFFVADEESLRLPVAFSFNYVYLGTNESSSSQPEISQIRINGDVCNTQGSSVSWDPERNQFFGYLAFELWVYNSTTGNFQNHDRMVDLRLYLEF